MTIPQGRESQSKYWNQQRALEAIEDVEEMLKAFMWLYW